MRGESHGSDATGERALPRRSTPLLRNQPSLWTERLRLRPFVAEDAEPLHVLAERREVADTGTSLRYPFTLSAARIWIAGQSQSFRSGSSVFFAMTLRNSGELIGAVELRNVDRESAQAELAFWVGVPWWGSGFASEASAAIVRFGFEKLGLNRIHAHHLARHTASGTVLRKLGMQREGVLRQRVPKWGHFEDAVLYAILAEDGGFL
jgi:RimJ/RimL family protein N-acetyltransferase